MTDTQYYLAGNKTDDYGNGLTELVQTTPREIVQYYWFKPVEETDIETLKKYFDIVPYDEEKTRDSDQRYYGYSEE